MTLAPGRAPEVSAPSSGVPAQASVRARRALLIDDEPGIRGFTARILSSAGFTVTEAATGSQGLSMAERDPCDLVLLDLRLPDLDGEEILRRLRRERPGQAVLVWSATADRRAQARCRALGACGYLPKPFTRAELMRCITVSCPSRG